MNRIIKCFDCEYKTANKKSMSNHLRYGCGNLKKETNKICLECGSFIKTYKGKRRGADKFCNNVCYSIYRSKNNRGANATNFKDGKCNERQLFRASLAYRTWRKQVFERDNYTCVQCGDKSGGNLEADHIRPFALYPELRLSLENGRTLCKPCHKNTHTYGYSTIYAQ